VDQLRIAASPACWFLLVAHVQHCVVCMHNALDDSCRYAGHVVPQGLENLSHDIRRNRQNDFIEDLGLLLSTSGLPR
jgi:hypothetical protein